MKICYLADAGNIHTQRWVEYFANNGHEVHLISRRAFGNNNVKNVNLHVLNKLKPQIRIISFPINLLYDLIQIKKLIRQINPDILHVHYISDLAVRGALTGFHPFVASAWGSDVLLNPYKSKLSWYFTKFSLKKADDIYAVSTDMAKKLTTELGISKIKMKVVPFGVDMKLFHPESKHDDKQDKKITVFSNRNFYDVYNIKTLICAIPIVIENNENVRFVIKGSGPLEKYLKELVDTLNIDEHVTFIGWTEYQDMPRYLHDCDIYVSTAISDGTPVSVLEAMACGKACIITDVGGVSEWIENGVSGHLIPPQQPQVLAENILELCRDSDKRESFGMEAHKIVAERGDWNNIMELVQQDYQSLMRKYGIQ